MVESQKKTVDIDKIRKRIEKIQKEEEEILNDLEDKVRKVNGRGAK
ncbi:MAG: hypothetical protein R6U96_13115 [Promethearchaeia archaeon]